MAIYYLSLTISFLILSALASVIYKFKNSKFELFYKIVGVVIGVVLLFRYALQDLYLEDVIDSNKISLPLIILEEYTDCLFLITIFVTATPFDSLR